MKKLLLIIDMQNDFVDGVLGTQQALNIVDKIVVKLNEYKSNGYTVVFSRDTHDDSYLCSQEGRNLPTIHCIKGTHGHEIVNQLDTKGCIIVDKYTFGSCELVEKVAHLANDCDTIEICGVCTDICVVSNAIILKAKLPEIAITVDSQACAGSSIQNHNHALVVMRACQVLVI
ncbi:MAG: cysteine hydrolase [Firmicutes bacterium]|nr:cysteine hydrolase [Bacillota bacterium]MCL1954129.1 cysteine hydrolase [Bacillota bacterium]